MSSASGSNSDDYNPDKKKKKLTKVRFFAELRQILKFLQRGRESDESDEDRPKKIQRKAPRKRRERKRKESSASSETPTEDESEAEVEHQASSIFRNFEIKDFQVVAQSQNPVDKLRVRFPHIPRSDIARAYYQNSCQYEKTADFLEQKWTPELFNSVKTSRYLKIRENFSEQRTTYNFHFQCAKRLDKWQFGQF